MTDTMTDTTNDTITNTADVAKQNNSHDAGEDYSEKKLASLPTIHQIPNNPDQSEVTLTSTQPRIDPLPSQTYVTPKNRLGTQPAWIDCDFCRRRTKTRVELVKIPSGNEGVLALLLCLVCPCLICLACMGDDGEEINHYCTGEGCGRKVTYKHPSSPIQVLKPPAPVQEVSKYGMANSPAPGQEVSKYGVTDSSAPVHGDGK